MPRLPALRPRDSIGIIAPASTPDDMSKFDAGCRRIESRGYQLVKGRTAYKPRGYLSGTDEERLRELNDMLARTDLSVLFCARGGFGTLRLLDDIDYDGAAAAPKLVVGYSDITALQLALYARADLPSISGPMIAVDWSDLDDESEESLWSLLTASAPHTIQPVGESAPEVLDGGTAEGPLIGGNLTALTNLLGTPYLPTLEGAIVFVEDIDEPPYRIDGMLAQLRLAGVLEAIDGMIFGQFTDSAPEPGKPSLSLQEVIDDYRPLIDGPTIGNFPYGHCLPLTSLPIGIDVRLEAGTEGTTLTTLEPVAGPGGE